MVILITGIFLSYQIDRCSIRKEQEAKEAETKARMEKEALKLKEEQEREETEKRVQQALEQERRQRQELEEAKAENRRKIANTLQKILESSSYTYIKVDEYGGVDVRLTKDGEEEYSLRFNVTGVNISWRNETVMIDGSVKVFRAPNYIGPCCPMTRNKVVFELLQKLKTAVMEDLVK